MNCREIQNLLELGMTSSGIEHAPEVDSHLAICPTCHAYAEELAALTGNLVGLGEIQMTEAETNRLQIGISRGLEAIEQKERTPFLARLLGWSVRPAAAAVFVVMIALMRGFDPAQTTLTETAVTSLPVVETNQANIMPLLAMATGKTCHCFWPDGGIVFDNPVASGAGGRYSGRCIHG